MNTLFQQSDVVDPYAIYAERLATQPVFHDDANSLWAVYSYDACKTLLDDRRAKIPPLGDLYAHLLTQAAASLSKQLVRLSNPPLHAPRKQVAMHLHELMVPVDVSALLPELLAHVDEEFDWVEVVCKKLPALVVLRSFGFTVADIAIILPHVEVLTKIMRPNKSEAQVREINDIVAILHPLVMQHLQQMHVTAPNDSASLEVYVSNLMGLLIQSYDAGRGLLSNALLQALVHPSPGYERHHLQQSVVETLRFDSPVHNTRRVLGEDMVLYGETLRKGEAALLVLASANRDPMRFAHPQQFDAARANNGEHLSFGAGMHGCTAHHLSVRIAVDALQGLFARYKHVALKQSRFDYEPLVNARLVKEMRIGVC
jgi:cytochrome P450